MRLTIRTATQEDIPRIKELMAASMAKILPQFLTAEAAARSYESMGMDTRLIDDGTYYLVFIGEALVGCGGWSKRRTLYGGDHSSNRDDAMCDPETEPAKIRAMYTHPDYVRRGIGRALLDYSEAAAQVIGFKTVELGATAAGMPLYQACGYEIIEDLSEADEDGITVPIILMTKTI